MAETQRSRAGQAITRHPLFPAIVALWVGALFGVASLLVSVSMVESAVLALGIDRIVPMAAPPLGATMRIVLALAMTGLGAATGFAIGRRFVHFAPALERYDAPTDEGMGESAGAAEGQPRRRRALTIRSERLPAVAEHTPIPAPQTGNAIANETPILNVAEFDLDGDLDGYVDTTASRPVPSIDVDDNLPAWLSPDSAWHEADEGPAVSFGSRTARGVQVFQSVLDDEAGKHDEAVTPAPSANRLFEAYSREVPSPRAAAVASPDDPDAARPGFKLLPRLQSGTWAADVPGDPTDEPMPEAVPGADASRQPADPVEEAAPAPLAFPHAEPAAIAESARVTDTPQAHSTGDGASPILPARAAQRIEHADLDNLSPVELLERLAHAMAHRRELARIRAGRADAGPMASPPFAAAPFVAPTLRPGDAAQDTLRSGADWQLPAAFVPAALRPVPLGENVQADDYRGPDGSSPAPLSDYVPPRHIGLASGSTDGGRGQGDAPLAAMPFPRSPFGIASGNESESGDHGADDDRDDEDAMLRQGYSSLLDFSRHFAPRAAIRFEAPEDSEEDEPDDAQTHAIGDPHESAPSFTRPTIVPVTDAAPASIVSDATGDSIAERPFDAPAGVGGRAESLDTEHALRAALATLQRMSGAA